VRRLGATLAASIALVVVCRAVPRRPATDEPQGRAAYARVCQACHGPEGSGGTAPVLVPFTLELSEVLTIVRQGIGVMPGIPRDRVSDEEIAAIREYLISLKD
jgi:mono/diheme cytochrome c family protein